MYEKRFKKVTSQNAFSSVIVRTVQKHVFVLKYFHTVLELVILIRRVDFGTISLAAHSE